MPVQSAALSCRTCQALNQTDDGPTPTAPLNDMFAASTSGCQANSGALTRLLLASCEIFQVLRRCCNALTDT